MRRRMLLAFVLLCFARVQRASTSCGVQHERLLVLDPVSGCLDSQSHRSNTTFTAVSSIKYHRTKLLAYKFSSSNSGPSRLLRARQEQFSVPSAG